MVLKGNILIVFLFATKKNRKYKKETTGGEWGIRTLDTSFSSYAPLAGECLRPLGQFSEKEWWKCKILSDNATDVNRQLKQGLF